MHAGLHAEQLARTRKDNIMSGVANAATAQPSYFPNSSPQVYIAPAPAPSPDDREDPDGDSVGCLGCFGVIRLVAPRARPIEEGPLGGILDGHIAKEHTTALLSFIAIAYWAVARAFLIYAIVTYGVTSQFPTPPPYPPAPPPSPSPPPMLRMFAPPPPSPILPPRPPVERPGPPPAPPPPPSSRPPYYVAYSPPSSPEVFSRSYLIVCIYGGLALEVCRFPAGFSHERL